MGIKRIVTKFKLGLWRPNMNTTTKVPVNLMNGVAGSMWKHESCGGYTNEFSDERTENTIPVAGGKNKPNQQFTRMKKHTVSLRISADRQAALLLSILTAV